MFDSAVLEVAIGIIFVYVLVSLICTAFREGIETMLKTRAAYLERGIRELLHDRKAKDIADAFFRHPMINSLFTGDYKNRKISRKPGLFDNGKNLPSYIPSRNFALALMDIAARGSKNNVVTSDPNSPAITMASIRANILNIQNIQVQRAMLTALDSAKGDLDRMQQNLENWFNSSMDRVSGWYKRSTQQILFFIGLVVAVGLNVNTITIADYLFRNDDQRKLIVAEAERATKDPNTLQKDMDSARAELAKLKLPIGWENGIIATSYKPSPNGWNLVAVPILGWLLTALAATLGAPFWFDMLNKIMVIRGTVKPTEKSKDEGSEDRRSKDPQRPLVIQMTAESNGQHPAPPAETAAPVAADGGAVLDAQSETDNCLTGADPAGAVVTLDNALPPAIGG